MNKIEFTDKNGTFRIHNPENYSGLYLPLAGETGLKSSITPNLGGDSKTDQNHFLTNIYLSGSLLSYSHRFFLLCFDSILFLYVLYELDYRGFLYTCQ